MTAEIAIMNKEAVALAADSAVTTHIVNEKKVASETKIFTSGNKLFALSYKHPIGIMVYNSAFFMEVPWETIIKTFRATLPVAGYEKLEDYTQSFLTFLASNDSMFSVDAKTRFIINFIQGNFHGMRAEIQNRVNTTITQRKQIDDATTKQIIAETIEKQFSYWSTIIPSDGCLTENVSNEIIKTHEVQIRALIDVIFQKLPLSADSITKLFTLASNIIAKGFNATTNSGVVIAGFGEKEFFPCLQSFAIEGIADNQVRRSAINTIKISTANPGQIIPFAQREMVDRFMTGVDPAYQNIQKGYIAELCKEYAEKVVRNIDNLDEERKRKLQTELISIGNSLVGDFEKKMANAISSQFIRPVYSVIAALPKNELAIMAESLVSITSLKRQFSAQEETVKEPIDVVIISKWDGFIWIKRKHYFKPEFNPHFFLSRGMT